VLLPPLDELVGHPGFGASRPILCGARPPYDPRMLFARLSRALH
jgi:hypothetical protein